MTFMQFLALVFLFPSLFDVNGQNPFLIFCSISLVGVIKLIAEVINFAISSIWWNVSESIKRRLSRWNLEIAHRNHTSFSPSRGLVDVLNSKKAFSAPLSAFLTLKQKKHVCAGTNTEAARQRKKKQQSACVCACRKENGKSLPAESAQGQG